MGRWKLGPQGAYYEPNDDGPDQVTPPPDQVAAMRAAGQPAPTPDSVQPMVDQGVATANGPGSYTAQGGSYYGAGGPSSIHGGVTGYGSGGMATPWTGFDQVPAMDGSGQSQPIAIGPANAMGAAAGMGGNAWQQALASAVANRNQAAAGNPWQPVAQAASGMYGGVPGWGAIGSTGVNDMSGYASAKAANDKKNTLAGLYQSLNGSKV